MKAHTIFALAAIAFQKKLPLLLSVALLCNIMLLGCIGTSQPSAQPSQVPAQNSANIVPQPSPAMNNSTVPTAGSANNSTPPAVIPVPIANQTTQPTVPAGVGLACGGASGAECEPGLQCITTGAPNAEGTCTVPAPPTQELQTCPSQRNETCQPENNPVCGRLVGGSGEVEGYRDYSGPCAACSASSNAIGYYYGTCAQKNVIG